MRYTDEQVQKIISEGTVKQKSRLFIRDRVAYITDGGFDFILSSTDAERLQLSVKYGYDREEWLKYTSLALRIENGFKDLYIFLLHFHRLRSALRQELSNIYENETFERLLNKLLNLKTFRNKEFDREVEEVLSEMKFSLCSPMYEQDGSINLNIHRNGTTNPKYQTIRERCESVYKEGRDQLEMYLCQEEALKRRIKELKLKIPEYEEVFKRYDDILNGFVPNLSRFSGAQDKSLFHVGGDRDLKDRRPREFPYPAMRTTIDDFTLRPVDLLPLDEKTIKTYYDTI